MCLAAICRERVDTVVYAATKTDAAGSGLEDLAFHDEMARQPSERRLPMRQALREEANEVLQTWFRRPDRIVY